MSARRACVDAAKMDVMETATAVTISTEAGPRFMPYNDNFHNLYKFKEVTT